MKHSLQSYPKTIEFLNLIEKEFSDNLVVKMEETFDKNLEETEHQARSKMVKAFQRSVKEVAPVSRTIYPMQIRMIQMRTNVEFLLECAHNKVSYTALAKYFAEYEFLSKEIKKHAQQSKNETLVEFVKNTSLLTENYFQQMMDALSVMKENVISRMNFHPEQYIDLNIKQDSNLDIDIVKESYKNMLKKLKEDLKKQNS